ALSLDNPDIVEGLKLYPNPANKSFKLNMEIEHLNIYDITGKEVKNFSGAFGAGSSFDISDLADGLYIVKIENTRGAFQSTKLIKQ
ncbi:MAG: T9SS type A sorting domain-containing protein, partial [Bacteroidia bacterium]|nr:T9SS type A sorting domain-containing protein [Bacteroidia bacterium]